MLRAPQSYERLRWRPWPCPRCCRGLSAVGFLIGRIDTGLQVSASSPEEIGRLQAGALKNFAQSCEHNQTVELTAASLLHGSEHLVYFSPPGSVYKLTRPGMYGESYYLVDGIINQKNCSPLEYLLRLRFWRKLFQAAPRDLGITEAGQIVSTDRFIVGRPPPQEQVDKFLQDAGLTPVKQQYWLWKRSYSDFALWVGDARSDNFVLTDSGIVPIDIRVWQTGASHDELEVL
jgi:hypothetical protein